MSVKDLSAYRSVCGVSFQVSGFSLISLLTPETRKDLPVVLVKFGDTKFPLNGSPKGLFHF
jgi:hypothetical protein